MLFSTGRFVPDMVSTISADLCFHPPMQEAADVDLPVVLTVSPNVLLDLFCPFLVGRVYFLLWGPRGHGVSRVHEMFGSIKGGRRLCGGCNILRCVDCIWQRELDAIASHY